MLEVASEPVGWTLIAMALLVYSRHAVALLADRRGAD